MQKFFRFKQCNILKEKKLLPHYTVKDYEKLKEDWKLVEGIHYALAFPNLIHQRIVIISLYFSNSNWKKKRNAKTA